VSDDRGREERQRRSWEANADAWTRALRGGALSVRERLTNAAVVAAVRREDPATVLDVGCGEGWLVHALAREGREAVGVDASAALLEAARQGPGRFARASYRDLAERAELLPGPFAAVVCNFSLLDRELAPLLAGLRRRLGPRGSLIVQTLHPLTVAADGPYRDGWREERFDGFGPDFAAAMPWYGRTLGSWSAELRAAGFALERLEEPTLPEADRPSSLLMTARPWATAGRSDEGTGSGGGGVSRRRPPRTRRP
jgi:2-polyprenyl-3-methyl-5-hydroxy-6-metoxy-1,4-benzoquinol methylase